MKDDIKRFIFAGVGGQGVLLAAGLLSRALFASGLQVKQAEIHGMAQRGGSVLCSVVAGQQVHSPLVDPGMGDVLLGLEKLEALRWAHYLKSGGLLVSDARTIPPVGLEASHVKDAAARGEAALEDSGIRAYFGEFSSVAADLGNHRLTNTILLGSLSRHLEIGEEIWKEAVLSSVPRGTEELNWEAFSRGASSRC